MRGYEPSPAKPIAAQPATSTSVAVSANTTVVRSRLVTRSQIPTGQRKSFSAAVSAAAGPATAGRSRYRQVAAAPTSRNDVSAPSASEFTTGADIAATP